MINKFRLTVITRVILICLFISSSILTLINTTNYLTGSAGLILLALAVYQSVKLISFVEKTNRDLTRFLESVKNDDFTQSFTDNKLGKSFEELKNAFNKVKEQFLTLRSEKEEHARYLQTVIRHIGAGMIVYRGDGAVELINTSAKKIFHISHLKNIRSLESISKPLVETLMSIKAGETTALRIESNGEELYLSINATQFRMKSGSFTLVSIQDIKAQIDMENMSRELEIAWEVQKSLLPGLPPEIPGYDIQGICKPAKEVGGDYYDFIPVGEKKLALIIGDVSGKGTSASFYMTLTKGFIQSTLIEENISPGEILKRVNSLMVNTINKRSFVTMFITILDWDTHTAVCARAGHNPAILHSKSGNTDQIKPGGIALGLSGEKSFSMPLEEYSFTFNAGDTFIMYTDGFIEVMDDTDTEEFGEDGLIKCISDTDEMSSSELIDHICSKVDSFNSSKDQYDDMTMICIKKN